MAGFALARAWLFAVADPDRTVVGLSCDREKHEWSMGKMWNFAL